MTTTPMPSEMLIIRGLPGIADLEVNLLLHRKAYEGVEQDLVDAVAQQLFGLRNADLHDIYEQHEDEDRDDLFTAWESPDDETMRAMLEIGIDFSNEQGHPLRCTNLLAGPAEVAMKGIAGHMPDQGQAHLDHMASKLEQEREAFLSKNRRRR